MHESDSITRLKNVGEKRAKTLETLGIFTVGDILRFFPRDYTDYSLPTPMNELMPEAVEIGKLRQQGLSDSAIADALGIKRTTFLSRLKKAKILLEAAFPDFF